ncbi:peptidyl-prolyl cis-trans isomerase G [Arabidopsis thaliana]|uniref:Peptidyl-prolyl cis-trans isomerase G n=1 Tax=Arabidopsis thaliana TaxID=3702 RepID=B3H5W3_ARATH|nr:peptidyl-prolyl cis-trans isomerase G [Arabidopsis thaliana]AED93005.1 peptidyl-prolyl cis-trans isomerase G [Arabidopsis thaliana]|eukprot:NP_001119260.1 peptidyl-prolyl cis-trans isomerase G [Arabidopsis thaliana]
MKFDFTVINRSFEWRQPLLELDAAPSLSQKHQQIAKREEAVKEKIILSQERHIQRLNDLVRSLQMQLQRCKGENETRNATETSHNNKQFIELERKHIVED